MEKSFKNKKASKAAILLPKAKLGGSNTSHGLDIIYSYFRDNWQVDTNCEEFTKTGENEFTLDVHMVVGEKFKIVVNHEWSQRGGYDYHDIDGIDMLFKAFQPEGEEDNVLVTASCHLVLRALIDGEFIHLILAEGELEIR